MAKKSSIFSVTQVELLKKELLGVVKYLQAMNLEAIEDEIDWKSTKTGAMMPTITSTIERKLSTSVAVIKQSSEIIKSVYSTEGLTDLLQTQIDITAQKLQELNKFFFNKDLNTITTRYVDIKIPDKKGGFKIMKSVAATTEDQIIARVRITDSIQKIIPLVDEITAYKTVTARGGKEMCEAMESYLMRKNEKIEAEFRD